MAAGSRASGDRANMCTACDATRSVPVETSRKLKVLATASASFIPLALAGKWNICKHTGAQARRCEQQVLPC